MRSLIAACLAALAACGSSSPPAPRGFSAGSLELTVRVRGERKGQHFAIVSEDTMKPKDFVEMFVQVTSPAYVYAVQFFSNGTSAVIFPEKGDILVQPGAEARIPEGEDWYQLEGIAGEENIYFVAARVPIQNADLELARSLTEIRQSGGIPDPSTDLATEPIKTEPKQPDAHKGDAARSEPDPPLSTGPNSQRENRYRNRQSRHLKRVKRRDGAPAVSVTADKREDPLVVYRFTIKYQ